MMNHNPQAAPGGGGGRERVLRLLKKKKKAPSYLQEGKKISWSRNERGKGNPRLFLVLVCQAGGGKRRVLWFPRREG